MSATKFTIANVANKTGNCSGLFALRDADDTLVPLTQTTKRGESFTDAEWIEIKKAMVYIRNERAAVSVTMESGLIVETHK
jgi:hypothetical protein